MCPPVGKVTAVVVTNTHPAAIISVCVCGHLSVLQAARDSFGPVNVCAFWRQRQDKLTNVFKLSCENRKGENLEVMG